MPTGDTIFLVHTAEGNMPKKETEAEKTARLKALRLAREKTMPPPKRRSYPIKGMETVLSFGKHKGETVEHVLETDPGWLRFALENVPGFEVTPEVERELGAEETRARKADQTWEGKV